VRGVNGQTQLKSVVNWEPVGYLSSRRRVRCFDDCTSRIGFVVVVGVFGRVLLGGGYGGMDGVALVVGANRAVSDACQN
jgi:hypothetical protein